MTVQAGFEVVFFLAQCWAMVPSVRFRPLCIVGLNRFAVGVASRAIITRRGFGYAVREATAFFDGGVNPCSG